MHLNPRLLEPELARLPSKTRWDYKVVIEDMTFWREFRRVDEAAAASCNADSLAGVISALGECREWLAFGDFDYDGAAFGWYCLRPEDGSIWGVCVDWTRVSQFQNSSLEAFIRTFLILDALVSKDAEVPANLGASLERVDSESYPQSYWKKMVEYLFDETV